MHPVNNKILVFCDLNQKNTVSIGGNIFKMANLYETNYRLKSPVICIVEEGNELIRQGDILLCHHNLFYQPSPYFLYGNYFSIPFSKVLFAKILEDGELLPICTNILGETVPIKTDLPLPPDQRKNYTDRIIVTNPGYTSFKKGQMLFTRPSAPYSIVYHWNNEQKTVVKISEDMITGIMK